MVHRCAHSKRKGMNGAPVPRQYAKARNMVQSNKYRRSRVIQKSEKPSRKVNRDKFELTLTGSDLHETQAVRDAQKKLKGKYLHPVGYRQLLSSVTAADRKRKPSKEGEKCIAVPHGQCIRGNHLASWVPCTFVSPYFPNNGPPMVILKRTEIFLLADKRLQTFFVVLASDCFLVPQSFAAAYDMCFAPANGVYVIMNATGDVYVGTSANIAKRVSYHNRGGAASFTTGKGKWWRVQPSGVKPTAKQLKQGMSQESVEMLGQCAIHTQKKVRGGYRTSK